MNEKQLKKLGFKKIIIKDIELGDFEYYKLIIFDYWQLNADFDKKTKLWTVSVFDVNEIEIKDIETLIEHIEHMKKITR